MLELFILIWISPMVCSMTENNNPKRLRENVKNLLPSRFTVSILVMLT
jgi:hypothetical protein